MATVPMRPQTAAILKDLLALGVVRLGNDGVTLIGPDGEAVAALAAAPSWTSVTGKPAVIAAGTTQALARSAIGITPGAAVADATDAASAITQLNLLLARMRALGFIS